MKNEQKTEKPVPQLTSETRAEALQAANEGITGEAHAVKVYGTAVGEVRTTPGYQAEKGKHAENFRASGIAGGLILAAVLPAYPGDTTGETRAKEFVSRIRKLWLASVVYKAPKRVQAEIELEVGAALAVQALLSNFTGRGGKVAKDTLRPMLTILRGLADGRLSLGDIAKACQVAIDETPAADEVQAPAADMVPVAM